MRGSQADLPHGTAPVARDPHKPLSWQHSALTLAAKALGGSRAARATPPCRYSLTTGYYSALRVARSSTACLPWTSSMSSTSATPVQLGVCPRDSDAFERCTLLSTAPFPPPLLEGDGRYVHFCKSPLPPDLWSSDHWTYPRV